MEQSLNGNSLHLIELKTHDRVATSYCHYLIRSHTFRAQTIVHYVFNIYSFSILHKGPTFFMVEDQARPGLVRGPRVEK